MKKSILAVVSLSLLSVGCSKEPGTMLPSEALRVWDARVKEVVRALRVQEGIQSPERPLPWPDREVASSAPAGVSDLTPDQISEHEAAALSGSPASASRLQWHYNYRYRMQRTPIYLELDQKWERIAAENGDPVAASGVASRLHEQGGLENCRRARYWYDRAGSGDLMRNGEIDPTMLMNAASLALDWERCVAKDRSRRSDSAPSHPEVGAEGSEPMPARN